MMSEGEVADALLRHFEEHPDLVTPVAPPHDLWGGIEARIEAQVLPLGATTTAPPIVRVTNRSRRRMWVPLAAAAVVLITLSSRVTYLLTRPTHGGAEPSSRPAIAARPDAEGVRNGGERIASGTSVAAPLATQSATGARHSQVPGGLGTARPGGDAGVARLAANRRPDAAALEARRQTEAAYDDEIAGLHQALDARRSQLDPATIATIEQNLRVIDQAIAQSRAALARDPASRFLNHELNSTLSKKLDLLRTAALLPSST